MSHLVLPAEFLSSATLSNPFKGPALPEFAFAGRSNVGKSSLINFLTGRKHLARVSATPGKTQTLNYYRVEGQWYLVDLPGYGYARTGKTEKKAFGRLIQHYLLHSTNLYCVFVLLDSRLPPQPVDIDFITWLGTNKIPLALVLTKTDKLSANQLSVNRKRLETELQQYWLALPPLFVTSSLRKSGRKELLAFIHKALMQS